MRNGVVTAPSNDAPVNLQGLAHAHPLPKSTTEEVGLTEGCGRAVCRLRPTDRSRSSDDVYPSSMLGSAKVSSV